MQKAIALPDNQWIEVEGSNAGVLIQSIWVNATMFHFTAIEVRTNGEGIQVATTDDELFGALHAAHNAEGHYQTTTIKGREYVLFGDAAQ